MPEGGKLFFKLGNHYLWGSAMQILLLPPNHLITLKIKVLQKTQE
ncbi:hypothetical protein M23134_01363 [Microscilla marina ATCC 23134]|uniref:Uncharacterized protein n=1 Tax=Microscilla marina ATCC 23134 TaxID=313606 RepID=A1ZJK6_MICM2|nr:hypothetical protein M23134_01363 [Microscilla marina ATCC 23134]